MFQRLLNLILISLVLLYKNCISPYLLRSCRFYPSCSTYTLQALRKYGPFKGSYLGIKRILCCHPWHKGGYDPLR